MGQWLTERMSNQERYVMERGGNIWVSLRSGRYQGLLSEAPDDAFRNISRLMEQIGATWGGTFESAVACISYDDKSDMGHEISIYSGLSEWLDEPGICYAEIHTFDSVIPVEVIEIDDDADDYLLSGGSA